jgi:hypothetical protein
MNPVFIFDAASMDTPGLSDKFIISSLTLPKKQRLLSWLGTDESRSAFPKVTTPSS